MDTGKEKKEARWKQLIKKINEKKWVRKLNTFFRKLVIPGFEGIPFLVVMKFFIESLVNGIIFQRAAAMTYRIFIAIIPMFMALFAAISFLDESIRIQLMDFIRSMVPDYTWPAISDMITGVVMKQNGVLLYSSFIIGLYLTVLCMNSVITSLNITYFKIQTRTVFQQLLTSLGLIIVFGIILILAIAIFVGTSYAIHHLNVNIFNSLTLYTWVVKIIKWLLLLILAFLLISILFYFAPGNKKSFRLFSAGSTFSTMMLVIILYALNLYFHWFPTYNVIYGSIGALFAIMMWLYWSSIIILIGFDLNVSIYHAKQEKDEAEEIVLKSMVKDPDNISEK